ncbi:MAG: 30S ribosome-binding factor RbfA [Bacilli bacterium]|nr:30S ribosome-binding factor RbfA [Bacilli bacterium]
MSVKLQKLEKQIERELSRIFLYDAKDDFGFITVTGVELTNDLSFAKVYYTVLGDKELREQVAKKLEKAKGFIKNTLGSRVQMRKLPELIFNYDESIEYGNRIDQIIKELNKEDK